MGAGIVLISVVALAIFCAAAALPRGLVMAIFVTLIATAALVIMFEVAPTGTELFSGRCESHSIAFVLAPASAWCALTQAPACGDVDQCRGKCAATDEVKHDQSPG